MTSTFKPAVAPLPHATHAIPLSALWVRLEDLDDIGLHYSRGRGRVHAYLTITDTAEALQGIVQSGRSIIWAGLDHYKAAGPGL
jgi:hypothetical protein